MSISIIVPAYNVERFVRPAIQSILDNMDKSDELIIINDGSTDNSLRVLDKIRNDAVTKNIQVLSIPHSGVAHARNVGVSLATKEWVYFMDADDFLRKGAFDFIRSYQSMQFAAIKWQYYSTVVQSVQKNLVNQVRIDHINIMTPMEILQENYQLKPNSMLWLYFFHRSTMVKLIGYNWFDNQLTVEEDSDFWMKWLTEFDEHGYNIETIYSGQGNEPYLHVVQPRIASEVNAMSSDEWRKLYNSTLIARSRLSDPANPLISQIKNHVLLRDINRQFNKKISYLEQGLIL